MLNSRPLAILFRIIGAACVGAGALVLVMQIAEWWSFGDWNAVSVGYVLGYFNILKTLVPSSGHGLLNFPVSVLFIGGGVLIALLGQKLRRQDTRTPHDISQ